MSDHVTARAIRDATRSLAWILILCSAFIVVVLPITSVVAVYTAAKWKAEAWASQIEGNKEEWDRGWERGMEQARERSRSAK